MSKQAINVLKTLKFTPRKVIFYVDVAKNIRKFYKFLNLPKILKYEVTMTIDVSSRGNT